MDDPYKRIFGISSNKDADLSSVRSNELLDAIVHKLAKKIANDLFTNGFGQRAVRLVLKLNDIDTAGGWSENAVVDRVEAILKSAI